MLSHLILTISLLRYALMSLFLEVIKQKLRNHLLFPRQYVCLVDIKAGGNLDFSIPRAASFLACFIVEPI